MARRPRKTRKLKQSIYIVAEGTNTERIYFEAIIEQKESKIYLGQKESKIYLGQKESKIYLGRL